MSDTFTDMKTPFRRFKLRAARSCNRCQTRIESGSSAWKPAKNVGSWQPSAVVCKACGDGLLKASRVVSS